MKTEKELKEELNKLVLDKDFIDEDSDDDFQKVLELRASIKTLQERNAEVKTAIPKIIAESDEIDNYFPKGDKRRGEVLVILAKLNVELLKELGLEDGE